MTFATPLALLGLLAIPAIIAIHLFRRRFPVQRVAGLFLWRAVAPTPEGGGRITRLPITTSLLLECLGALALTLIAAGVRCSPAGVVDHLIVLLDDSASMSARNAAGESARDRAVRRVLHEVDALGGRGRVTLVVSGDRPSVIAGPTARPLEARRALEAWTPKAPHHPLAMGLRFARELAGDSGRLLVLSDAPPTNEAESEGALWVAVGEQLANAAITAAHRSLSPEQGGGTVSLTFANHAARASQYRLTITAAGKEIAARTMDLPPGVSSAALPLPPGLPPVRVALSDDALVLDNEVTLAEPRPQIVGVANRLGDERGRDALDRALNAIPGLTRSDTPHLVFADASEPRDGGRGAWRVTFGGPAAASRSGTGEDDFAGPYVLEKRHPLLQGVTLNGVVWTGPSPQLSSTLRPLATTGDRPLIGISPTLNAETEIHFNLDLQRTNLIRSPDWPILVSNLVELRRQELPGPERWNYRAGEWIRVRLGRDPQAPVRMRCGGSERELPPGGQLEFIAPAACGVLTIFEGDDTLFELGVNFLDDREADLQQKHAAEVGRLAARGNLRTETSAGEDPLFWILLAVTIAAVMTNWAIVSPRGTRP